MEIVVISDAISFIAYPTQSFGLSNFLTQPHDLSLPDTNHPPRSSMPFRIFPTSHHPTRTLTKRRLRKIHCVRRRISVDYTTTGRTDMVPLKTAKFFNRGIAAPCNYLVSEIRGCESFLGGEWQPRRRSWLRARGVGLAEHGTGAFQKV
ncbi:Unknown protein [Striga hermonthica]|uniref:Uncharacterized protein n=1 Tax=Striga hermonthica TaxID=68872 RepID=A0A9N7RFF1_STRHE|nr:Unknown protein [Striga hermonthica]